ncbi:MAG: hypothetical protein AB8H86_10115 [Polyangiales bacterium]
MPGAQPPMDPSTPDPEVGVGRSFELFGVDGRCTADSWRLDIDAEGRAEWFNIRPGVGEARGDDVRVVVDFGDTILELFRTGDEWSGFYVWHVFRDDELIAWAVEIPPRAAVPAGVPSFRACAVFEQWSLHELGGGESHGEAVVDVDPESWRGEPSDFPLWLDVQRDGTVFFHDIRLRVHDGHAGSGVVEGEVVSWDGTEGVVRVRNSVGLCSVAEGEIIFRRVRNEIHVMQSWHVVDIADDDNDGDREERHLRRTRSVLTAGACPFSLRR